MKKQRFLLDLTAGNVRQYVNSLKEGLSDSTSAGLAIPKPIREDMNLKHGDSYMTI